MSDPGDGDRADGPSDVPLEEDPFEYPFDDSAGGGSSGPSDSAPAGDRGKEAAGTESQTGLVGWLTRFWTADSGAVLYARDILTSVAAVLFVGLLLFAVSGIWPPMVAVESGSMEPNMNVGDLVFVVDNERFVPGEAVEHEGETTGVVPADVAAEAGHTEFGGHGDVIVYQPNGNNGRTPVIHRAMLFVEEGENWYDRADPAAIGTADDCEDLNYCPAPHAGFVTLGDANARYDQQTTLSSPVKPGWIIGTAEVKVPYLGHVRLAFSGQVAVSPASVSVTTTQGDDATADAATGAVTTAAKRRPGTTTASPTAGPTRPAV